ncbi:MAG: class II aldolase/adducin family protein [Acidimicrobiales bacterium]
MSETARDVHDVIAELVVANRILAHEGVIDALGHLSARHPRAADRYLLSCSRSAELINEDDIMEFDLNSEPIEQRGRPLFAERSIHGSIYKARPDVNAICHNHAHQLIPFATTATPIRPVWVMGATIGEEVPTWDIRHDFPDQDGLLVVKDTIGSSLAKQLGAGRACLLAGYGAVVAEADIPRTVLVAISLMINAELQMQSLFLTLADDNKQPRYLSKGEITSMTEMAFNRRALERMWEYWASRADPANSLRGQTLCNIAKHSETSDQ